MEESFRHKFYLYRQVLGLTKAWSEPTDGIIGLAPSPDPNVPSFSQALKQQNIISMNTVEIRDQISK
jgi:hypothetical protein